MVFSLSRVRIRPVRNFSQRLLAEMERKKICFSYFPPVLFLFFLSSFIYLFAPVTFYNLRYYAKISNNLRNCGA